MNGGRGPDTFVYTAVDQLGLTLTTGDFFKGFTPGSDTVDLSAIDAIAGGADDEFTLIDGAFTGRGDSHHDKRDRHGRPVQHDGQPVGGFPDLFRRTGEWR